MSGDLKVEVFSVDGYESLLLQSTGDGRKRLLAVEPFTWAWVGVQLAGGAVSYVGGRLLSSMLGGGDSSKKIIEAIRSAVVELKNYIRTEFNRNTIEECAALCGAAWRDLLDYEDVPEARRNRLDNALSNSRSAMLRLAPLGRAAFGPYVHASSILLIALQAEAKAIGKPEAWWAVVRSVDESVPQVEGWIAEFEAEHAARRASVTEVKTTTSWKLSQLGEDAEKAVEYSFDRDPGDVPEGPRDRPTTYYSYSSYAGTVRDRNVGKVRASRAALIQKLDTEIVGLNRDLVTPSKAILQDWRSVGAFAKTTAEGNGLAKALPYAWKVVTLG